MAHERRCAYRVQFGPHFSLDDAVNLVPYLSGLGVSHLYASPLLGAVTTSTHGYDVVDPSCVNATLGGEPAFRRLVTALAAKKIWLLVDIVPNHLATHHSNPWWWSLLAEGPASPYAAFFDVDWERTASPGAPGVLMFPVLGAPLDKVLARGELRVEQVEGVADLPAESVYVLRYFDRVFPLRKDAGQELAAQLVRNNRGKKREGGTPGSLGSTTARQEDLAALLACQHYRLVDWRRSSEAVNYRRFFDINDLAAVRVEHPPAFTAEHQRVARWFAEGDVDGLRVDHIDGMLDPAAYLRDLSELVGHGWVLIEKILCDERQDDMVVERLPVSWQTAGTTGYDFCRRVGALLTDPAGEAPLTECYRSFVGEERSWNEIVREAKQEVVSQLFCADIDRLAALFASSRALEKETETRSNLNGEGEVAACRVVIADFLVSLDVYRTYVPPNGQASQVDADRLTTAGARAVATGADPDRVGVLIEILQGRRDDRPARELCSRFQQLSGPVMAKGVEDTAMYRYFRFVSLNEVGADPGHFGLSLDHFHAACAETLEWWPETLLATSTHDTKRSEDVRARLQLLAEIPGEWWALVQRWAVQHEKYREGDMPSRNAQYLLYQTLVGAWPLSVERVQEYMCKATREEKRETSWLSPDPVYEKALVSFIGNVLEDKEFCEDLGRFVERLTPFGRVNSLAQTLLKLTCPGVPDIYQGTELWNFRLVDPDNRCSIDFDARRSLFETVKALDRSADAPEQVMADADEGLPKLWLIHRTLRFRERRPDLYAAGGSYVPLAVSGPAQTHAVTFLRGGEAVTFVPRWPLKLAGAWEDTMLHLPEGQWANQFTGDVHSGGEFPVANLLARFPVALLVRTQD